MKKLSYFAIALGITAMVACDNNKDKDDDDDLEDMTEQVDPNATDQMSSTDVTITTNSDDEVLTVEEETFGTDVK